jgi:hypothetical protein
VARYRQREITVVVEDVQWHVCCIRSGMTNFFVYMIGVVLVVGALAYGASLLGLGSTWIAVIAIAALGLGLMGAIVKTRQKEPS